MASAAKSFGSPRVAEVFASYPPRVRHRLMRLRRLIFETAAASEGVGQLEECLKWGEPAYLTVVSKTGSTIRLGWKKSDPSKYALHFNCQTRLVGTFRALFPYEFTYVGNRSIVFDAADAVPARQLARCIALALTYHRRGTRSQ